MNIATYAFTIVAARLLGPRPFGGLAAVMNVLLVAGVVSLALQATAARRIAREPGDVHEVEAAILTVGRRSAIGLGVLLALAAPLVDAALKLDSIGTALLMAFAVVPITHMGAQAGVLQGERRWLPLSVLYLAAGVPRLVLGTVALLVEPDETVAVAAVAVAAWAPVLVGSVTLRRLRIGRAAHDGESDHSPRALWWETVYNSQALLAFLVLSNVDIVIARNTLDGHAAGLYAGGLILVKAVLFLPQFVVVLAFPSMGTEEARRSALTASLGLVALAGVCATLATWLLSGLALVFVGGSEYGGIEDDLWAFAVLGTLLSMIQLLVYSVVARQARNSIVLLWLGLAVLIGVGLTSSSVTELVGRVIAVDAGLFVVLLGVSLWRLREAPAGS
ncbi:MAG: oligosaccharide flippase family protein [Nocardioidaceae bacterium]|nr:oligosaccharide flippase family protein [Nocardioidaceae bacterium]